jgi:hypothetical protein
MRRRKIGPLAFATLLCALTLALPAAAKPRARAATDEEARMAILCVRDAIIKRVLDGDNWLEFEFLVSAPDEYVKDNIRRIPRYQREQGNANQPPPRCAARSAADYAEAISSLTIDPNGLKGKLTTGRYGSYRFLSWPFRKGDTLYLPVGPMLFEFAPKGEVNGRPCGGEHPVALSAYLAVLKQRNGVWTYVKDVDKDDEGMFHFLPARRCEASGAALPQPPPQTPRDN